MSSAEESEFTEGVRLKVTPAPLVKRLIALAIDIGVISVGGYILFLIFIFLAAGSIPIFKAANSGDTKELFKTGAIIFLLIALLALAILGQVYFIVNESKKGATPGKRLMGLRVTCLNGSPISRKQAIYRDFVRWYIDIPLVLPALISMLATKNRQRVGDLLADTVVVYSRVAEEREKFLYLKREDFILIQEHVIPDPVPEILRHDYLEFAAQALLWDHALISDDEKQKWISRARQQLKRTEELGMNDETVLRFFAELCLQQEIKRAT
jgi:uncharacterized RDD family membrane protein YckC